MMKNALKGTLLSGLVFPGLGQVYLKHYKRGIALMLIVSGSVLVIVVKAVLQAFTILEKIASEGQAIDMSTILNAATQASTTSDSLLYNFLLLLTILCWIIGIIDAYRIGKKRDLEAQSTSQASNTKSD
jgi:TM2 domain-containing membrane protein YozV